MVFGGKSKGVKFYLGENELQIVGNYKYLGLMVERNFGWKQHLGDIVGKARKRMRALCGMGLGEGVSAKALLRGWQVLIRPC